MTKVEIIFEIRNLLFSQLFYLLFSELPRHPPRGFFSIPLSLYHSITFSHNCLIIGYFKKCPLSLLYHFTITLFYCSFLYYVQVNTEAVKVDISHLYILLKYLYNADYILSFFEKSTDFLLLPPGW